MQKTNLTSGNILVDHPIKVGAYELPHRAIMAPLTRQRAGPSGIPNQMMLEYYTQRSEFGLIISEGCPITSISDSWPGGGQIETEEQIKGWKQITQQLHDKGSRIFLQIYHGGRVLLEDPIAPSPIKISTLHASNVPFPIPREMTQQDIDMVLQQFKQAAINAKTAGFDGIQIHAANGYLIDQFLRDGSNTRTDKYGGSIENRSRFLLEVLDTVIEVFGADKVGIRFSPTGRYNDMYDSNPVELMRHILQEIQKRNIAFIELKRHDSKEGRKNFGIDLESDKTKELPENQMPDFFKQIRQLYKGIIIGNDGLSLQQAKDSIEMGEMDLVAFGKLSISNPDLINRIRNNYEIDQKNYAKYWFGGNEEGYTTFQNYSKQL